MIAKLVEQATIVAAKSEFISQRGRANSIFTGSISGQNHALGESLAQPAAR